MACGQAAETIYILIDELAGGGDERPAKELILDELIRWTSGDDIRGFVENFRRHHDMPTDEEE
jgi:hypothetical protein